MIDSIDPRPIEDHRVDREAGAIVYPVYSRRSGGLSLGINLFPDEKICSFDCVYCEVFPFRTRFRFDLAAMERGLRSEISSAEASGVPVKDICFSGNGEPTLSPNFPAALEIVAGIRDELCPSAFLVVITNASTLSYGPAAELLARATAPRSAGGFDLDLWVKLDAGTAGWYAAVDRSDVSFDRLISGIEAFASGNPVTVQTMVCAVAGAAPPPAEEAAWLECALRIARGGRVRRFHLYGKARPAPEDPASSRLPAPALELRAEKLRAALAGTGLSSVPVEVFP